MDRLIAGLLILAGLVIITHERQTLRTTLHRVNDHRVNVMFAASAGILGTIHPGTPWPDLPLAALLLGLCALSVHPALCIPLAFIGAQQLSATHLTAPPTTALLGALIGTLLPLASCRARGPVITAFGILALSLT